MLGGKTDPDKIQTFDERSKSVLDFLKSEGQGERCAIFAIDTMEGGADSMKGLEALIVSDEISVVANAFEVNEKRAHKGFPRFHIVVVPRVRTEDGAPLSSSRIRRGESFERKKLTY
jgi:phosphopantetheine adenylyltransferase